MKERFRQSFLIGAVGLAVLAVAGETDPQKKVVKQVIAGPGLTGGGTGPKVTLRAALDEGPGPNGTLTEMLRFGQAAPGGGTFAAVDLRHAETNGRGVFAFASRLAAPEDADYAVFVATQQGTTLLAKTGDVMPDGSVLGAPILPVLVSDTGRIYIAATTAQPYVDGVGATGALYGWDGSQWFTVLGKGSQAADGKPLYWQGVTYAFESEVWVRRIGPRALNILALVQSEPVGAGWFVFQSP